MIKKIIPILVLTMSFALPASAMAQDVDVFSDVCKKQPNASVCKSKEAVRNDNPVYGPNGIITKIVNLITLIVGIAAVISIMFAGFRMITSGDNSEEVTKARELIIYALIGLLVAAFAQIIVRLVLFKIGVT